MERAKELIESNIDYKMYEIADEVGFGNNPQYFSNVFKKYSGYNPTEYRILSSNQDK